MGMFLGLKMFIKGVLHVVMHESAKVWDEKIFAQGYAAGFSLEWSKM